jgi:hypothetical protein
MYSIIHDETAYPKVQFSLRPDEVELILHSLAESAADSEDCDEPEIAARYVVLERRFARAAKDIIPH